MHVERLRKQAKELVKAARRGDAEALERLGGRAPILARAHLVIAREQGYPSWPALIAAAEASADEFVLAATGGHRERAELMLRTRPQIKSDRWAGLVLGSDWRGDANEVGGPCGWSPLLYACHSVFRPARLVRELLERGADVNQRFKTEWGEASALYGAAGVVHDEEITRLLLEAGADPNDGESLYHSLDADNSACLRLLLDSGAETRGANVVDHALDYDRIEPLRILLERGADPNEAPAVALAVRRGRSADSLRLLAQHGADLDRPGPDGRGAHGGMRTGYQYAVLRGYDELARTLAELGASTNLDPADAAVAAFRRGEAGTADLPNELDLHQKEALVVAALGGRLEDVVARVGVDFRAHADGSPEGTLLHHAAWYGNPAAAAELLAGAPTRTLL
jgi:ankyrin repeat protein